MDVALAVGYIVISIACSCIVCGAVWIVAKILLGASCLFTRKTRMIQGRSRQSGTAPYNIDRERSE